MPFRRSSCHYGRKVLHFIRLTFDDLSFWARRSVLLSTSASILSWAGKLILPFGVAAQYAAYIFAKLPLVALARINIGALSAYGLGQVFLALRKAHEIYERPKVRDIHEIRKTLHRLANLRASLEESKDPSEVALLSGIYLANVLRAACTAICRERHVVVTLMTETKDEQKKRWLSIRGYHPSDSDVDVTFRMEIIGDENGEIKPVEGKGVAAYVYGGLTTIYVPNTSTGLAKFICADGRTGRIRPRNAGDIWLPHPTTTRRAGSIFAVPIHLTTDRGPGQRPLGVLNFEGDKKDAFADADLHLACTFGHLLAHGLWLTSEKMNALTTGFAGLP